MAINIKFNLHGVARTLVDSLTSSKKDNTPLFVSRFWRHFQCQTDQVYWGRAGEETIGVVKSGTGFARGGFEVQVDTMVSLSFLEQRPARNVS